MADGYNGWSNRATWNVSLWLSNEEGLYNEVNRLLRRFEPDEDEELDDYDACEAGKRIETFCKELWPNGCTPDDDRLADCDFEEVARSWLAD